MARTDRNRDFWKMRQLASRASAESEPGMGNVPPARGSAAWEMERLWAKYGFKSMVMDRRRRVSTQKGNARFVRLLRRVERRRADRALRAELAEDE